MFKQGLRDANQFIATQGPKPNTLSDFWEMIWCQNSSVIVMLCKCKEKGKVLIELVLNPIFFSLNFCLEFVQIKA